MESTMVSWSSQAIAWTSCQGHLALVPAWLCGLVRLSSLWPLFSSCAWTLRSSPTLLSGILNSLLIFRFSPTLLWVLSYSSIPISFSFQSFNFDPNCCVSLCVLSCHGYLLRGYFIVSVINYAYYAIYLVKNIISQLCLLGLAMGNFLSAGFLGSHLVGHRRHTHRLEMN